MKHIVKIITLLVAISAMWFGLLEISVVPRSQTWLLPIYFIVSLGCYGLLMVGIGLMHFPTCPQEAVLLQQGLHAARTRGALWTTVNSSASGVRGTLIIAPLLDNLLDLSNDIVEAKHYLKQRGVNVGSE